MPHRNTALVTRCDRCDQTASVCCARCGRPLCTKHAPSKGQRCEPCETEGVRQLELALAANDDQSTALHRERRAGTKFGPAVGLLTATWSALAVIARGGSWWLVLVALVLGVAVGLLAMMFPKGLVKMLHAEGRPVLDRWTRYRARRKFLAERPGKRLLTKGQDRKRAM